MSESDACWDKDFARLYDWSLSEQTEDLDFFVDLVRKTRPPILVVACGTGRLVVPLARAGFTVTGVEMSPAMYAVAKARVRSEKKSVRSLITLRQSDLESLHLGKVFPAVLVPSSSLLHLSSQRAFGVCFGRVYAHTRRGGIAVFDLASPRVMGGRREGEEEVVREGINPQTGLHTVERARQVKIDRESQVVRVEHVFLEGEGEKVRRWSFEQSYRWLEKNEAIHLLQSVGFSDIRAFGNYDGTPYSDSSPRLILIASRRSGSSH